MMIRVFGRTRKDNWLSVIGQCWHTEPPSIIAHISSHHTIIIGAFPRLFLPAPMIDSSIYAGGVVVAGCT